MNRSQLILLFILPVLALVYHSCGNSPTGSSEFSTEIEGLQFSVELDDAEVSDLSKLSGTLTIRNLSAKKRSLVFSDPCMFRYRLLSDGIEAGSVHFNCIGILHGISLEPFGMHSQELLSPASHLDEIEKGSYQLLTYLNLIQIDEEFTGQETYNNPVGKHVIIVK